MKEITFEALRPQTVTETVSEDDLRFLNKILKDCLMSHIEYHDFRTCITPFESEVIEMCKKYGVDPGCSKDRLSLFKALLQALDN